VLALAVVLMLGESAIALANPWRARQFTTLMFSAPATAEVPGLCTRSCCCGRRCWRRRAGSASATGI
jgi:hypothetical protein